MDGAFDLNLRHLRMLSIIAENGSLSAAAKAASISQPALTQALAKLEVAFGAVLFDRTAAGVIPTASGRRVLQRVERALKSFALACRRCARTTQAAQFENYLTSAHVRGLMTLAESGSFLRAADAAGVSVPSLHRAVRDLEKLSGTALVERRGRGVGMTRAGAKLARGFTIAVTELGAAIEETTDGGGRLSIGAMALSRSQLLPATLAELLRERPHVRIDVIEGSYLELVDLLRSGKIDILIGALRDAPGRDLFQEPLFTDRLTVIGRAEHPLAGKFASFDQLGENSWIVARRASGLLDRWQEIFDRSGKPRPEAPIQCGSVALIRGLLLRTDFLTLLSTDQVRSEIEAGTLVRIESDVPDTMRTIGAITRRDWFPTKLQDAFMVALRRTGREAMPG
jgi:DNA-binding transcriptional LysR family regulator